jgi:glycosyltransferase involved in cell wall biosynthesis
MLMSRPVTRRPLRVLQVVSNLGVGGAETWLLALLKYFREAGDGDGRRVETDVLLTHGIESELDADARALGANLIYCRYSRGTLPGFVSTWRGLLARGDYAAIHDHQENTAGLHFLMGAGRLPRVRIAHVHNPLTHHQRYASSPIRRGTLWLGRHLISRYGTHVLGTSRQLIAEQGFMGEKFSRLTREAVHCGFDTGRFTGDHAAAYASLCREFGWPDGVRIALFAGRLDSHPDPRRNQKNPIFALDVARAAAARDDGFRLLMAGGGESVRLELERRVAAWGLSDRIRLIGRRNDIPRLMLGTHTFLLTSIAEGLGMVVVEAQAAGLPALVSDATPKECRVGANPVRFLGLDEGAEAWATSLLETMNGPRPAAAAGNRSVRESGFAIENSAKRLLQIYSARS